MLGRHGGYVGVVVLHRPAVLDLHLGGQLLGNPCGEVAGVEVVDDEAGIDAEEAPEAAQGLVEVAHGLQGLQVSDVLAHMGGLAAGEGERVLQVSADGQERGRRLHRKPKGKGRVATAPAEEHRPLGTGPDHRVVVP